MPLEPLDEAVTINTGDIRQARHKVKLAQPLWSAVFALAQESDALTEYVAPYRAYIQKGEKTPASVINAMPPALGLLFKVMHEAGAGYKQIVQNTAKQEQAEGYGMLAKINDDPDAIADNQQVWSFASDSIRARLFDIARGRNIGSRALRVQQTRKRLAIIIDELFPKDISRFNTAYKTAVKGDFDKLASVWADADPLFAKAIAQTAVAGQTADTATGTDAPDPDLEPAVVDKDSSLSAPPKTKKIGSAYPQWVYAIADANMDDFVQGEDDDAVSAVVTPLNIHDTGVGVSHELFDFPFYVTTGKKKVLEVQGAASAMVSFTTLTNPDGTTEIVPSQTDIEFALFDEQTGKYYVTSDSDLTDVLAGSYKLTAHKPHTQVPQQVKPAPTFANPESLPEPEYTPPSHLATRPEIWGVVLWRTGINQLVFRTYDNSTYSDSTLSQGATWKELTQDAHYGIYLPLVNKEIKLTHLTRKQMHSNLANPVPAVANVPTIIDRSNPFTTPAPAMRVRPDGTKMYLIAVLPLPQGDRYVYARAIYTAIESAHFSKLHKAFQPSDASEDSNIANIPEPEFEDFAHLATSDYLQSVVTWGSPIGGVPTLRYTVYSQDASASLSLSYNETWSELLHSPNHLPYLAQVNKVRTLTNPTHPALRIWLGTEGFKDLSKMTPGAAVSKMLTGNDLASLLDLKLSLIARTDTEDTHYMLVDIIRSSTGSARHVYAMREKNNDGTYGNLSVTITQPKEVAQPEPSEIVPASHPDIPHPTAIGRWFTGSNKASAGDKISVYLVKEGKDFDYATEDAHTLHQTATVIDAPAGKTLSITRHGKITEQVITFSQLLTLGVQYTKDVMSAEEKKKSDQAVSHENKHALFAGAGMNNVTAVTGHMLSAKTHTTAPGAYATTTDINALKAGKDVPDTVLLYYITPHSWVNELGYSIPHVILYRGTIQLDDAGAIVAELMESAESPSSDIHMVTKSVDSGAVLPVTLAKSSPLMPPVSVQSGTGVVLDKDDPLARTASSIPQTPAFLGGFYTNGDQLVYVSLQTDEVDKVLGYAFGTVKDVKNVAGADYVTVDPSLPVSADLVQLTATSSMTSYEASTTLKLEELDGLFSDFTRAYLFLDNSKVPAFERIGMGTYKQPLRLAGVEATKIGTVEDSHGALKQYPPPAITPTNDPKLVGTKLPKAGVVVYNAQTQSILFMEPANHYNEVGLSLPKGTVEAGETLEQGAVRECFEETGHAVRLIKHIGDVQNVRWFLAETKAVNTDAIGDETSSLIWGALTPQKMLYPDLQLRLRPRDKKVVMLALKLLEDANAWADTSEKIMATDVQTGITGYDKHGVPIAVSHVPVSDLTPKQAKRVPPKTTNVNVVHTKTTKKTHNTKAVIDYVENLDGADIPEASDDKSTGGGSNPAWIIERNGMKYRLKASKEGTTKGDKIRAHAEESAWGLMSALKADGVASGVAKYKGRVVAIQPLVDADVEASFNTDDVSHADAGALLYQHVIDMFMGDHDGHAGNWLRVKGKPLPIDRGQAFKFHVQAVKNGSTYMPELHPSHNPAGNVGQPLAKKLLLDWSAGTVTLPESAFSRMALALTRVRRITSDALRPMLANLADSADVSVVDLTNSVLMAQATYLESWTAVLKSLQPDFAWAVTPKGISASLNSPLETPADMGLHNEVNDVVMDAELIQRAGTNGISVAIAGSHVENQEVLAKVVNLTQNVGGQSQGTLMTWKFTKSATEQASIFIQSQLDENSTMSTANTGASTSTANNGIIQHVGNQYRLMAEDTDNKYWEIMSMMAKSYTSRLCRIVDEAEAGALGIPGANITPPRGGWSTKESFVNGESKLSDYYKQAQPVIARIKQEHAKKQVTGTTANGEPYAVVYAMLSHYMEKLKAFDYVSENEAKLLADNPKGLEPIVIVPFDYVPVADKAQEQEREERSRVGSGATYFTSSTVKLPGVSAVSHGSDTHAPVPYYTPGTGQGLSLNVGKSKTYAVTFKNAPGVTFAMTQQAGGGGPRAFFGKCWAFMPGVPSPKHISALLQTIEEATGLTMRGATAEDQEVVWLANNITSSGGKIAPQDGSVAPVLSELSKTMEKYDSEGPSDKLRTALRKILKKRLKTNNVEVSLEELEEQATTHGRAREGAPQDENAGTMHSIRAGWTLESLKKALTASGLKADALRVSHQLGIAGSPSSAFQGILQGGSTMLARHSFQENGVAVGESSVVPAGSVKNNANGSSATSDIQQGGAGAFGVFRKTMKLEYLLEFGIGLLLRTDIQTHGTGDSYGNWELQRYASIPALIETIHASPLSTGVGPASSPQVILRTSVSWSKYLQGVTVGSIHKGAQGQALTRKALGDDATFYNGQSIEQTIKG